MTRIARHPFLAFAAGFIEFNLIQLGLRPDRRARGFLRFSGGNPAGEIHGTMFKKLSGVQQRAQFKVQITARS